MLLKAKTRECKVFPSSASKGVTAVMLWPKNDALVWGSSAFTYFTLTVALALGLAWLLQRQRKASQSSGVSGI